MGAVRSRAKNPSLSHLKMVRQALTLTQDELRQRLASLSCYVDSETTLKTLPGSIHWHIKRLDASGTLEATWLPGGEAWLSYHSNRHAPWIDETIEALTS